MAEARSSIIRDRHIYGAPDLIIEVLSPGNSSFDLETKYRVYEKAGVPEYAIVDARIRELRPYHLQNDGVYGEPVILGVGDTCTFACLPTITFRVGALFDGAPDTSL